MNVDLMRKIDFYAGVPLCFLGTLLLWPFGRLKRVRNVETKRVLLIGLSEMGSIILASPCLRKLEEKFAAELFFLTFNRTKICLHLVSQASKENVFTIRENAPGAFILDTIRFFFWARRNRIDTVVDIELFSRYSALLAGFSGAVNKVGFHAFFNEGLYRGGFLTHRVQYNPHMHIAKNFLALAHALIPGTAGEPYSKVALDGEDLTAPKMSPDAKQSERVREIVKSRYAAYDESVHQIILINAEASNLLPQRRWPRGNFQDLIRMILRRSGTALALLTGMPEERRRLQSLADGVADERCVNFAGCVTFEEMIALFHISQFMVTNDSGPNHFASATHMPTFVIFGPETPDLYGSLGVTTPIYANLACSPCVSAANHRKTPCADNVCLKALTPEHVFGFLAPILKSPRSL